MIHNLIFSGIFFLIILALGLFYYRRKMIGLRPLLISLGVYLAVSVLLFAFILK